MEFCNLFLGRQPSLVLSCLAWSFPSSGAATLAETLKR